MLEEAQQDLDEFTTAGAELERAAAPVFGALPPGVVMSQRAAADLRAWLEQAGLPHYRVFHCPAHELYDIERCLEQLDESSAAWEPMPALVQPGQGIAAMTHDDSGSKIWEAGVLRLAGHHVVLARWYWIDVDNDGAVEALWLAAAPSAAAFAALRKQVVRHRRSNAASIWQVVRGYAGRDGPRIERAAPKHLLLDDEIRQRIVRELVGFFHDEVATLYREMQVPYRRGTLLHGPPGNGKSSLIRWIGHQLPRVPGMILRPGSDFDTADLEEVIRRWSQHAPGILVIEDLNWLLKEVNVSTFLNLLDGIESTIGDGLLLIATSNHPEQLDPAINNRPGRFDVVIEIPCPNRALRLEFLQQTLSGCTQAVLARIADETRGLSFAHLHEIVRLSGLQAIHAGRRNRSEDDVREAARIVTRGHEHAADGFVAKPDMPFGLLPLHKRRESGGSDHS